MRDSEWGGSIAEPIKLIESERAVIAENLDSARHQLSRIESSLVSSRERVVTLEQALRNYDDFLAKINSNALA